MHLFKNKKRSRYWQIGFEKGGKMTSISTKTINRKKAEIILNDFKTKFENDLVENSPRLKNFSDEYIKILELYRSASYINRSIKPALKELIDYFGNIQMGKLNPKLLEKFILSVYCRSKYSGHLYLKILKAAFNKAVEWNYIPQNYWIGLKLPRIQRKEPNFISYKELMKIIKSTDQKIWKNISISFETSVIYDFTTSQTHAYTTGPNPMVDFGDGNYGMISGDANGDGSINATDLNSYWIPQNGTPYDYQTKTSDFNLDGSINASDLNTYWIPNNGKSTQVPISTTSFLSTKKENKEKVDK